MSSSNENTRERILKATWELMVDNNGQAVRMTDIAKHIGISRQAIYLHFESRTELMIKTTHYVDDVLGLDDRLKPFHALTDGTEMLREYVRVWGNYIPEIYGIGKVLIQMKDTDKDAAAAWNDRMLELRKGCNKIISTLEKEKKLCNKWSSPIDAVDMFWTILSVHNWEQLTKDCEWSNEDYIIRMNSMLISSFISKK